jgi:hypothetical protein
MRWSILLVLITAMNERQGAPTSSDPRCGSRCLYVALRALEFDVPNLAELETRLGGVPPGGFSLAQLEQAARSYGAQTLGVKTSADNLTKRVGRFCCIAHLNGSHFVLLADIDGDTVSVADPPGLTELPIDTLMSQWSGVALLVSRDPLEAEESLGGSGTLAMLLTGLGCVVLALGVALAIRSARQGRRMTRVAAAGGFLLLSLVHVGCAPEIDKPDGPMLLVLGAQHRDLGDLPVSLNQPHVETSEIENVGSRTAEILKLEASCACSSVVIDRTIIDPGVRATVRMRLSLKSPGEKSASVEVWTVGAPATPTRVSLRWNVHRPVEVDPPALDFGALQPGSRAAKVIRILRRPSSPADACRIVSIEIHPPDDLRVTSWETDSWDPLAESLQVELEGSERGKEGAASVRLLLDDPELPIIEIPVSWHVPKLVEVAPSSVFLGSLQPGTVVQRSALLEADGLGPEDVLGVAFADPNVPLPFTVRALSENVVLVQFSITAPNESGRWRRRLSIELRDFKDHDSGVDIHGVNVQQPAN